MGVNPLRTLTFCLVGWAAYNWKQVTAGQVAWLRTAPNCRDHAPVIELPTSCSQKGMSAMAAMRPAVMTLVAPPPTTKPSHTRWRMATTGEGLP